MPRNSGRFALAWVILSCLYSECYAQKPGRDLAVGQALAEVDAWLDKGTSAEGWRKYLRLQDLQAQLELEDAADVNQVVAALERLETGVPGLERPQFVKLRQAVIEWRKVLSAPQLDQLSEIVREGKKQFHPADAAAVDADRAEVVRAAGALRRYLGTDTNGRAWITFLQMDALDEQLRAGVSPSREALGKVLMQYRADRVGLDQSQFANVATALANYIVTVTVNSNPKSRAEFDAQIDKLSEHLQAYVKDPSEPQLKQIGVDLDWLVDRRQVLPLVDSITHRLSQPNLYVNVSADFIAAGMNRQVDETSPVRDVILGTRIVGTGRTQGDVSFRLLPNADVAMLEATLEAVNHSRNTGYNGPAVIHSVGTTRLLATKWLTLDAEGIHGLPATAGADTESKITSIGSSKSGIMGCVVERVATKRVGQQKGSAEKIAAQHAETRLSRQFEEQIGKELARSNLQFQERFRNPLVRRGHLPHIYFSTNKDWLYVTALQAHGAQLGAQAKAPDIVGKPQVVIRLHESLVNNFTAGTFAGETVGQPELEKFAKDFLGEVPERLKEDPDKEPWTITFADEEPIIFKVADGGFMLTGRGKKYTSGSRSFPAMNFTVNYKIEKQGEGVKATRIGDIEIFPPGFVQGGGKRLSLPQTTLRQLMVRRLNKIFEAEIVKDQPTALKGEFKAAGPLGVEALSADQGWLSIGWHQVLAANVAEATGDSAPAASMAR